MNVPSVKYEVSYWDEGNKNMFPWYKKGFWKRHGRKKFIKEFLKHVKETD